MMYPRIYEMEKGVRENDGQDWSLELALVREMGLPMWYKLKVWHSGSGYKPFNLAEILSETRVCAIRTRDDRVFVKKEGKTIGDFLVENEIHPRLDIRELAFSDGNNAITVYERPFFSISCMPKQEFEEVEFRCWWIPDEIQSLGIVEKDAFVEGFCITSNCNCISHSPRTFGDTIIIKCCKIEGFFPGEKKECFVTTDGKYFYYESVSNKHYNNDYSIGLLSEEEVGSGRKTSWQRVA